MNKNEMEGANQKETELLRLIQVKSEKIAGGYLTKERHTQLSYLAEEERLLHIAVAKGAILDRLIAYLKSI